jgi:hypothetical protein
MHVVEGDYLFLDFQIFFLNKENNGQTVSRAYRIKLIMSDNGISHPPLSWT